MNTHRIVGIELRPINTLVTMLKKVFMMMLLSVLLTCTGIEAWAAKRITIKTIPESAQIWIDGQLVGEGTYKVKFDKDNEFYVVSVKKPGYISKRFRLLKSNPNNSVVYTLHVDEAMEASTGSENGAAIANQWMDITCRKGMKEDIIWKRLMNICTNYFSNVQVRDKSAGWIKTAWKVTPFTHQTVRTRMEIRINFVDEDVTSYQARIISEIKDNDCYGDNCYEPYDRVLKKYEPMIEELQTSVGGGE